MGPTRTGNFGCYTTSTTEPGRNMGRTENCQDSVSERVPGSLNYAKTSEGIAGRAMVRFKYIYWCISHQQYVEPSARRKLRNQLHCKIIRLNLTTLRLVDS